MRNETLRSTYPLGRLGLLWAAVVVLIGAFHAAGVPMTKLSVDALQRLQQPVYLGLLSNLGVLAWWTGAAVALFTSFTVPAGAAAVGFLRSIGTLTVLVALDDLFMIHDVILPVHLGIPEATVYPLYGALLLRICVRFRRFILEHTEVSVFATALVCFAISAAIDVDLISGKNATEDLFKVFGILAFSYSCLVTSAGVIRTALASSENGSGDPDLESES